MSPNPMPKLVEGTGYLEADIITHLGSDERYAKFCEWMRGQTVGVSSKGETLTYPWDYQRFLSKLPCTD